MLDNKQSNLLLCITGSIAAYKSVDLARLFIKNNFDVRVIMTEPSKEFITPLTLQAVSGHQVHENLLDTEAERAMGHIELAKWADLIVIAPCSAETISRLAQGRADDLLGAVILASKAKKFIAPAMNMNMWSNQTTQQNVEYLSSIGMDFVGPSKGEQACGDNGYGRMSEPEEIYETIMLTQNKPLAGKKIIITAGPTREQIDPVRFISNNSSGKMGYSIAEAALEAGALVNLVSGPVALIADKSINLYKINSASEMMSAVKKCMKNSDIFIGCAAVSDYKPSDYSSKKIKKDDTENLDIELKRNEDILAEVALNFSSSYIVGFAAETSDVKNNAKKKLLSKNLDMIISNDVSDKSIGFDVDDNEVNIITSDKNIFLKKDKKIKIARQILKVISNNINT